MKRVLNYLSIGFLIGYCIGVTFLVSLLMVELKEMRQHSKELSISYSETLLQLNTLEIELRKAGVYYE